MRHQTILVIDDERGHYELFKMAAKFTDEKCVVIWARDCEQAITECEQYRFDVILFDLNRPDTLQAARTDAPARPASALSRPTVDPAKVENQLVWLERKAQGCPCQNGMEQPPKIYIWTVTDDGESEMFGFPVLEKLLETERAPDLAKPIG